MDSYLSVNELFDGTCTNFFAKKFVQVPSNNSFPCLNRAAGLSTHFLPALPPGGVAATFLSPANGKGAGAIACSMEAIRPSCELEGEAEADMVVAVVRLVVVAVRSAAVLRVVVPAAAAQHAVDALRRLTYFSAKCRSICVLCESQ